MPSLPYFAGFFDGEGCVLIYERERPGRTTTHQLSVEVIQVKPPTVELFHQRFGGHMRVKPKNGIRGNPAYVWRACGRDAEAFLREVLPYLILKRPQAEVALRLMSTGTMNRWSDPGDVAEIVGQRKVLYAELRALNRRGNDV